MKGQELWQQLCAQAAAEKDPKRLMELVEQINAILQADEERLKQQRLDGRK
jgi:hypothetical protein